MSGVSVFRREVCFLIGRGGAVLWGDAGSGPISLPDSRARWEALWRHRHELEEVVHSHPLGPRAFSDEDESTMKAIQAGLGVPVRFSVLAPQGLLRRVGGVDLPVPRSEEPWWTALLRAASGMS